MDRRFSISIFLTGDINKNNAVISAMFVTFEPNISPRVIPMFPLWVEKTATLISGEDVAIANMMNPAVSSPILVIFVNFTIAFIAKPALFTKMAIKAPSNSRFTISSSKSYHSTGTRRNVIIATIKTEIRFKGSPNLAIFFGLTRPEATAIAFGGVAAGKIKP